MSGRFVEELVAAVFAAVGPTTIWCSRLTSAYDRRRPALGLTQRFGERLPPRFFCA